MKTYFPLQPKVAAECRAADLAKVRLGRYPFRAGIKYYIARRELHFAESSLYEHERKLRAFADHLELLLSLGLIKTTDPRHMSAGDLAEWLIATRKTRKINAATEEKYRQIMSRYLETWGNNAMSSMAEDIAFPKAPVKAPVKALTVKQHQDIIHASKSLEGASGCALRGFLSIAMATGCRPGEIFEARVEDVDLSGMRYYVRKPKGLGKWSVPQWIEILRPELVPMIADFLTERRRWMDQSPYLLCNPGTGEPYTGKTLRNTKDRLCDQIGFHFTFKDLRSSFASLMIAGDLSRIKAVSLQMRHSKLETTEKYYLRINRDEEIRKALGEVWKESPIQ